MYKKSLTLLFIITSINSSFAFVINNPMPPQVTMDSEYLRNLEHFNPATKAGVLIRKKELDHLQIQERKSMSTSNSGWCVIIFSLFAAGIAGCCLSKGEGQNWLGGVSAIGMLGGLTNCAKRWTQLLKMTLVWN